VLQPLRENISPDVRIIGAGIAGMSVAYDVAQTGKKIAVLDDGTIGSGTTDRTILTKPNESL
jgi:glycine/D-amino acid oxidase-like deaminating enzyme